MYKKADLSGGFGNKMFGNSVNAKPMDPETLNLAVPLAAIALASYGGYKFANNMSDKKAAAERKQRIKDNLNRLGKLNLEVLSTVRKEAGIVGTMFNPLQGVKGLGGEIFVPDWFRPSGSKETTKVDALAFKTLALAATYGVGIAGAKYLMSALERQKELKEGNKKISTAVKASMPIISPDPSLRDTAAEEKEDMLGLRSNVLLKESQETEQKGFLSNLLDEAATGIKNERKGTYGGSAKAAALLLALGAFGTGAVFTKEWADERDPNRQRIKAAEKAAARFALQRRPPAIIGAIDPKIKEQLDKHITSGRLRVRPQLEAGSLYTQEVDPTDTLSRNIAAV